MASQRTGQSLAAICKSSGRGTIEAKGDAFNYVAIVRVTLLKGEGEKLRGWYSNVAWLWLSARSLTSFCTCKPARGIIPHHNCLPADSAGSATEVAIAYRHT
jgi:hypothetical protein